MSIDLIMAGVVQGLILAMIAYGIMIPFRFLSFPDLTAEGAYPLGGALCAGLMSHGTSVVLAMLVGIMGAGAMAMGTAFVHLKLKVNTLLAGIILSTMAYSINLRIMGKPNLALFDNDRLFHFTVLSLVLIIAVCVVLYAFFLRTDFGLRLRAVGLNPAFVEKQGVSLSRYTILGLFMAGALFGLAGGCMVQIQHYMDVGMGVGIVIHGLASLMIGESVMGNNTLNRQLIAPLVGALLYQQIQGLALSLGLAPSDLKCFTGAVVLVVIAMKNGGNYVRT